MVTFKKLRKKFKQTMIQWLYNFTDSSSKNDVEIKDNTLVIAKNDFIVDRILFGNFLPYIRQSENTKTLK